MITRYTTQNSTYEHDFEAKRLRRVRGVHEPTANTGTDGVWKDVDSVWPSYGRLLIHWADGTTTVTSTVVSQEVVPA